MSYKARTFQVISECCYYNKSNTTVSYKKQELFILLEHLWLIIGMKIVVIKKYKAEYINQ